MKSWKKFWKDVRMSAKKIIKLFLLFNFVNLCWEFKKIFQICISITYIKKSRIVLFVLFYFIKILSIRSLIENLTISIVYWERKLRWVQVVNNEDKKDIFYLTNCNKVSMYIRKQNYLRKCKLNSNRYFYNICIIKRINRK